MVEMFKVVTVEQAKKLIQERWQPQLSVEKLNLGQGIGRRLAVTIFAREDVPGFARSTMDGYAVRAEDTFGASEGLPVYLEVIGEVPMGNQAGLELTYGQAARINTGGMLPTAADAVVMLENTEEVSAETLAVLRPAAPGENIIRRGEDILAGAEVLRTGSVLGSAELGVMAALGQEEIEVEERLKVAIISTGNEIVGINGSPGPGQVRDINSYTLLGLVKECGAIPVSYGIVADDAKLLRETLELALAENQMVLLSGGSSVGTRDLTLEVLQQLPGSEILFHGLALKPGKPTMAVSLGQQLLFGLPGHPVSALVVARLLLAPLWRRAGYPEKQATFRARLTRNLSSSSGKEEYVGVRLSSSKGELLAEPILGKSGLIGTLSAAEGLLRIPLESEGLAAGAEVDVLPL